MNEYTDQELLALIAKDDHAAFTALYDRYWERLYALAYRHLQENAAAEEIVQEVFLVIWQKRDQLRIENVPGYLAAVARFATYRYLAGEEKKQVKERAAALAKPAFSATEKALEDRLMLEIVEKLTNKLPEKCRLVFIHSKLMDLPIEEVAARLSISVKTAEAHLTKALRIIRQHLGATALSLLLLLKP